MRDETKRNMRVVVVFGGGVHVCGDGGGGGGGGGVQGTSRADGRKLVQYAKVKARTRI